MTPPREGGSRMTRGWCLLGAFVFSLLACSYAWHHQTGWMWADIAIVAAYLFRSHGAKVKEKVR